MNKTVTIVLRYLLGVVLLINGVNMFGSSSKTVEFKFKTSS